MADLYSPKKTDSSSTKNAAFTTFWPFTLLALSLCAILIWQLIVANQVREHGAQMREQNVKLVDQSRRVQAGLQKFAKDLVEVSKTDEEAKAIVTKYGISVNQAAAAAPAAQATP